MSIIRHVPCASGQPPSPPSSPSPSFSLSRFFKHLNHLSLSLPPSLIWLSSSAAAPLPAFSPSLTPFPRPGQLAAALGCLAAFLGCAAALGFFLAAVILAGRRRSSSSGTPPHTRATCHVATGQLTPSHLPACPSTSTQATEAVRAQCDSVAQ